MKLEQKESALMRETHRKRVLLGVSSTLMGVTVIQLFLIVGLIRYAHTEHEVHFIPPAVSQEFSLSSSGVSESYLHDMTLFLVQPLRAMEGRRPRRVVRDSPRFY